MAVPDIPSSASPSQEQTGLIAPGWHTAVVLVALLSIAVLSAWRGASSLGGNISSHTRMVSYSSVLAWEWPIVAFIAWGVRRRGYRFSELIGGRWPTVGAFARDIGIALLFILGAGLFVGAIRFAMQDMPNPAVRNLLPESPAEMALWVALSATAGFCEETIFRGYLQKQFSRLTRDAGAGIALQAVVFGACHGYQGVKSMVSLTVYGLLLGLLADRRQSLRPGMLAHFLQDSAAGVAGRALLKRFPTG